MPRRKKGGASVSSALNKLKQVNKVLKDTGAVSMALRLAGQPGLASKAAAHGYGRRRRRRGRGRQAGGSLFGDIAGKVASLPAGLVIGGTAGLHSAISGLGRQSGGRMPVTNEFRKVLIM